MAKIQEETTFSIMNDEGKQVDCEILFTFDSCETNKSYVVYTDNTMDENGNVKVYASVYQRSSIDGTTYLESIETESEWQLIQTMLDTLHEQADEEDIELWMLETENIVDSLNDDDEFECCMYNSKIVLKLMDENFEDYIEPLFALLNKVQKKAMFEHESHIEIGMEAYKKKYYPLAEYIFMEIGADNNLAYMIRRGEVKDPSKYSNKMVAELLKEGVQKKDIFSMINMSLFWALKVGGDEAWCLADNIMSRIPEDELSLSSAVNWWLDVGREEEMEGYLVHYWLLKYDKVKKSLLGSMGDIRDRVERSIKDMPLYI